MVLATPQPVAAQAPGGCETPVNERTSEAGCYFVASEDLGELPQTPLYWHLYNYSSRAEAEAVKGSRGTVIEVLREGLAVYDRRRWMAAVRRRSGSR